MDDQTTAELLTGVCDRCSSGQHAICRSESLGDGRCTCRCTGVVECPTCGASVVLYADDDIEETGISTGECCHWVWHDWWEGTFRFDLSQARSNHAR